MPGVSIGWFEPAALYPDVDGLIAGIRKMLLPRLRKTRAWPLAVSSIRAGGKGTGVAYALVGGHIPIHIDQVGLDDSDGRIFQFVLQVSNRPALIAVGANDKNTPVLHGFAPPQMDKTFGLGGFEMHAGHAIHFDITTHFHGVTALPMPMESLADDLAPRAVIVQVAGFDATDVGKALEHAAHWVKMDVGISTRVLQ